MEKTFRDVLKLAVSKKDASAIYVLCKDLGRNITELTVDDLYSVSLAIGDADEELRDETKRAIAKALLSPKTEEEHPKYPILELASEITRPVIFHAAVIVLEWLDDAMRSHTVLTNKMMHTLGEKDVDSLKCLLDICGDKFEKDIMSAITSRVFNIDFEVRRFLVSYAVKNRPLYYLQDPCFGLAEIKEHLDSFTEEEIFAMLFVPERIKYPQTDCSLDMNNLPKTDKEILFYLGSFRAYFVDKDGEEWIRQTINNSNNVYIKILGLGTYVFHYAYTFKTFIDIFKLSPDVVLTKYNIFPKGEKPDDEFRGEKSLFDGLFTHGFSGSILFAIKHADENSAYSEIITKLLVRLEYFDDRAIEKAIRAAVDAKLDKRFIQPLRQKYDLEEVQIGLNRKYYIKCLGGDAVAIVKVDQESLCPSLKYYIDKLREDGKKNGKSKRITMSALGYRNLFFVQPTSDNICTSPHCDEPIRFIVVGFSGSVYGAEKYYIQNGDRRLEIKIGSLISQNNSYWSSNRIHFYYTEEMAKLAYFD